MHDVLDIFLLESVKKLSYFLMYYSTTRYSLKTLPDIIFLQVTVRKPLFVPGYNCKASYSQNDLPDNLIWLVSVREPSFVPVYYLTTSYSQNDLPDNLLTGNSERTFISPSVLLFVRMNVCSGNNGSSIDPVNINWNLAMTLPSLLEKNGTFLKEN